MISLKNITIGISIVLIILIGLLLGVYLHALKVNNDLNWLSEYHDKYNYEYAGFNKDGLNMSGKMINDTCIAYYNETQITNIVSIA